MKNSDKIKNSLIDEFYNEDAEILEENLKQNGEYIEFKNALSCTSEKIAVLNEEIFDCDIDTLSIVEQGMHIKESNKAKKEFLLFIICSFIILALYTIAIIEIGSKILIISQILIITLMPWIIIPILIIKRRGSEA